MFLPLQIPDSSSEPTTDVGYTSIYRSGTDLKVKFGDGTVKTVTMT